jgi:uncharacterized membrane protein (DUF2068 family)
MRAGVDEAALRAVITYKWVKGVVQLLLGTALAITLALGMHDELARWAHEFRNHSTRAYAVVLGRLLERATTPRGLHITLAALFIDGTVTCLEGWALQARRTWGPWVVVAVTGSLLPFEVYELFHHFRWIRLVVLLVNMAVVAFLVVHARAQARELKPPAGGGESPDSGTRVDASRPVTGDEARPPA